MNLDAVESKLASKGTRVSAQAAGYMELEGAVKDGDCKIVSVRGGISKKLGCCNLFKPARRSVKEFRCGMCKFED